MSTTHSRDACAMFSRRMSTPASMSCSRAFRRLRSGAKRGDNFRVAVVPKMLHENTGEGGSVVKTAPYASSVPVSVSGLVETASDLKITAVSEGNWKHARGLRPQDRSSRKMLSLPKKLVNRCSYWGRSWNAKQISRGSEPADMW